MEATRAIGRSKTVLTRTPPPFIIGKCSDENYLRVVDENDDGVLLSLSYFKGSFIMSRPTGFTNLAISAAFLALDAPNVSIKMLD